MSVVSASIKAVQGDDLLSGPLRVRTGARAMRGSCRLWSRMNRTKSPLSLSRKVSVPPNLMLKGSQRELIT